MGVIVGRPLGGHPPSSLLAHIPCTQTAVGSGCAPAHICADCGPDLAPIWAVHYTHNLTNPTVNLKPLLFSKTMKYMKLAGAEAVIRNLPFMTLYFIA